MNIDPLRSCRSKKRYATESHANTIAAECFDKRGHWLRVYACVECGGYHLTSTAVHVRDGWRPPKRSQREIAEGENRKRFARRKRR